MNSLNVSQLVEPTIVNFVQTSERQFQTAQLDNIIEEQNEARFSDIEDVKLQEFAKNFVNFFDNNAADFSVEALESSNISSVESFTLAAFKLFDQVDVPATDDATITDKKVTAQELQDFAFKANFILNTIGDLIDEEERIEIEKIVYFGTRLRDIVNDVDNLNQSVDIVDFTNIFQNNVDASRVDAFDDVLDQVVSILEDSDEKPVIFNAFF